MKIQKFVEFLDMLKLLGLFLFSTCLAASQNISPYLLNQAAGVRGGSRALAQEGQPKIPAGSFIDENSYFLGPGDGLNIYLGTMQVYYVSPEGYVSFEGLAPVKVDSMNLKSAKKALKVSLAKTYDTTKVFITLAGPNNYKISITGEVATPGTKSVSSFSKIEDVVAMSGGFSPYAIRNQIINHHSNGESDTIKVLSSSSAVVNSGAMAIRFGDVLEVSRIDFSKPYCIVRNENESYFHQLDGESKLNDIFFQINNYSQSAMPSQMRLSSKGISRKLKAEEYYQYIPLNGDTLEFRKEKGNIFVGGAVLKPGPYDYIPNNTAIEYIYSAGLTPQSTDAKNFKIYRDGVLVNPSDSNFRGLQPGDKIYLERSKVDSYRDFLAIIASLASIVISSLTLYFTVNK